MENIKIALVCGLCQGCKTAIALATESAKAKKTTIFKEIVHNKNVNSNLEAQGILCANNFDDIDVSSTVIVRAHGEPPSTFDHFNKNSISFIDGTCKNVRAIHEDVKRYSEQGWQIVIVGKYGKTSGVCHPEVLGTIGYCKTQPILIEDFEDTKKIIDSFGKKIFVICQTTFNPEKFEKIRSEIMQICQDLGAECEIKNTICGAQMAIQKASKMLAENSDLMIVVGGKNSSNSLELFNNVSKICKAIFIEDINDWQAALKQINFQISPSTKIGLTAGASTDKTELENLKILIENHLSKK